MIYIYLNGRLGNYLFQVGTGLSLSEDITLIAPSDKIYKEVIKYPTIFGEYPIVRELPKNVPLFQQQSFYYEEIPYTGQDIVLKGDFQAYKYLNDKSALFIKSPADVTSFIEQSNLQLDDCVGIHVRRGDYLKLPHRHPFCGKKYYMEAVAKFPNDAQFIVCSDDIEWCKKNFKGEKFHFIESGSALIDFFMLSACKANIISNSTFSWWASFINHERKRIIAPSRWFGVQLAERSTKDLYLPKTEIVQCSYDGFTYIKAIALFYKDKFTVFLRRKGLRK